MSKHFPTSISMETAAQMALEAAQHAQGVTCRMNKQFKVEYVNPDGSLVPGYSYFLEQEIKRAQEAHENYLKNNPFAVVEYRGVHCFLLCAGPREHCQDFLDNHKTKYQCEIIVNK